jgi:hypothetical protein
VKYAVRSTQNPYAARASRGVLKLDPGLRRDDEQKRLHYAINYLPDLLMVLSQKHGDTSAQPSPAHAGREPHAA